MRINQAKRIYMNEEGASPGGGATPPAPAQPPAPNGAPTAEPVVPVSQVKDVITQTFGELKNAFFADLRRSGALGKEKPAETTPNPAPQPTAAAAPAPTGLSLTDVEAMLEQERVITRSQLQHGLTDAQVKRMKGALKADRPDDISTWASTYLADMGLAKQTPPTPSPTQVTPPPVPQPSGAPISDKGSPAPGSGSNWNREFAENPLNMSAASIASMELELGKEVARKKRVEAGLAKGAGIKVTPR